VARALLGGDRGGGKGRPASKVATQLVKLIACPSGTSLALETNDGPRPLRPVNFLSDHFMGMPALFSGRLAVSSVH
jgi:hypothetical protein